MDLGSPKAPGKKDAFKEFGCDPELAPTDHQTPKNSKSQRSDSKATFGATVKVTQKLLKSDSKVTRK